MTTQSPYPELELCRQAFNPSPKAFKFLEENSYLIPDLLKWHQLEPFPQYFVPKEIEVVYDGITFIRISAQVTYVYQAPNPDALKNYLPEYSEYFFDGEIGVFHCGGEVLIDRTQNLQELKLNHLFPNISVNS